MTWGRKEVFTVPKGTVIGVQLRFRIGVFASLARSEQSDDLIGSLHQAKRWMSKHVADPHYGTKLTVPQRRR